MKTNWKNIVRIEALIYPWNKGSIRVVEKCGFIFEGLLRKRVHKNGKDIGYEYKYPFLDIFIVREEEDGNYNFSYQRARDQFEPYKINEVYPLKRYPFGKISLFGPSHYKDYFDRSYGSDWNEIAYMQYDHMNEKSIEKIKVNLTPELRKYAEYAGPIIKR